MKERIKTFTFDRIDESRSFRPLSRGLLQLTDSLSLLFETVSEPKLTAGLTCQGQNLTLNVAGGPAGALDRLMGGCASPSLC